VSTTGPSPRSTLFPTRRSSDLARLGPVLAISSASRPPGRAPGSLRREYRGDAGARGGGAVAARADSLGDVSALTREGREDLPGRSEEHTSELQSRENLVCRLLL